MDDLQKRFTEWLGPKGIELSPRQLEQFERYYQELVEWNQKMNLTGITEREQVYMKHFYDSLSLAFFVDLSKVQSLADIGSGAGFPGIPLKIAFPELKLTIVDSLAKRISFLRHVADELELSHVELIHGRAEDIARLPEHRDRYDLATARAVARMALLNEFCLPFVRPQGLFVAMKGSDPAEELTEAVRSLKELKGEVAAVESMTLPVEESARHLVVIRKTAGTPSKYPRKAGVPAKSPLI
ncbi:16S rRNA (guanine(527)-N(7))-methyltransferase RsmG [Paenibacillus glufosinatiresistens]|uniref:16S rRNA (guanine(527)-N(7))-methyltransferase RsmG n=1 Tax=Paenibacillus glufosinatiresistens TaxID=3070657 RepID=UPI00286E9796|nr:16S rRNA (guanine(527)-N(7))-methyltransferase RsmG [Paenibacillus sp. YX.27]